MAVFPSPITETFVHLPYYKILVKKMVLKNFQEAGDSRAHALFDLSCGELS
jgi:hypothetical protein